MMQPQLKRNLAYATTCFYCKIVMGTWRRYQSFCFSPGMIAWAYEQLNNWAEFAAMVAPLISLGIGSSMGHSRGRLSFIQLLLKTRGGRRWATLEAAYASMNSW